MKIDPNDEYPLYREPLEGLDELYYLISQHYFLTIEIIISIVIVTYWITIIKNNK